MSTTEATVQDANAAVQAPAPKGRSLWMDAYHRLKKERLTVISFWIVVAYGLVALLSALGVIGADWSAEVGPSYQSPFEAQSLAQIFGTDIFGRSVLYKTIHGAEIAFTVGLVVCLIAIPVGILLGSLAGYFGGVIDDLITWFYTTLSSIPNILLILAIAFVLGKGIETVYIALGATYWVGLCRIIRGEVIKHKNREYVMAASSLGASHFSRMFKHILPNVFHQVIITFSLLFQTSIKAEVILSYLGVGVQGEPSWGIMINDAKLELARDVWWQLTSATVAMFFLVLAFNILGDALRDALDPKLK